MSSASASGEASPADAVVKEIEAARFQPDEEDRITQEHNRASNAARLLQLSQAALDLLSENENLNTQEE